MTPDIQDEIIRRINCQRRDHLHGEYPTELYLGHEEWRLLMQSLKGYELDAHTADSNDLIWRGMIIYKVMKDSHIGFGVV